MDASTDEDVPAEQRKCKQCNKGITLMECGCAASVAWRALRRQLTAKRSLPVPWGGTLDVLEGFCKRQRMLDAAQTGMEGISIPSSGDMPVGSSKSGVEGISTSHTGASSSATAQPKAKAAPRQPLRDIVGMQRNFDTAEDGQKYVNKGPPTLPGFLIESKRAQGTVHDFGIQRASNNEVEVRYGPPDNKSE